LALDTEPSSPACRLLVCVGPRCDAEGRGRALLAALRQALAADPAGAAGIAIATRDCLRFCTRDPVVRVESSGDVFSNPSVDELLRAARAACRPRRLAKTDHDA